MGKGGREERDACIPVEEGLRGEAGGGGGGGEEGAWWQVQGWLLSGSPGEIGRLHSVHNGSTQLPHRRIPTSSEIFKHYKFCINIARRHGLLRRPISSSC